MRTVCEAMLNLSPKPDGFTCVDLAEQVRKSGQDCTKNHNRGQAPYDLSKFCGKGFAERSSEPGNIVVVLSAFKQ
ncbi:MAG: hypothetical protein K9M80_09225 [Candidatus Marinimicrobia bacterium]|nr:hypothetical protein [Candidatus Neomarinimicrobiota bacterium]